MADRPTARDDDRLPWLEPFGEGERAPRRKPATRTVLIALLVAFFGIGLAVAFSLGSRFARPAAKEPAPTASRQPQGTASVEVPLAPPVPLPKVELIEPPTFEEGRGAEAPVVAAPTPVADGPTVKKAPAAKPKAKAKKRTTNRKPILRPFINIKKRAPSPQPVRVRPTIPFTPRGRIVQLGAYSTKRKAESAYRSIVWRYPYLGTKPKVVSPTPPVGGWTYYRLRLGTETQAQSLVICQRLQARGQSCIVIY